MARAVRIGVVDSGHACDQAGRVVASAAFMLTDDGIYETPATPDALGHGERVVSVLAHCAPHAELCVAQVFRDRLVTSAAQVAAAVDWLVTQRASVINLSLGLHEPRPVLAGACARAVAAGVIVCAASPARGEPVYPAAFDGVWSVTGDARCAPMDISALGTTQADFGAHVRPIGSELTGSGASMACAYLSGHVARHLASCSRAEAASVRAWLAGEARFHGPQRPGSHADER